MSRILSIILLTLSLLLIPVSALDQTPLTQPRISNSWSWADCGLVDDVVEIKSLALSPDPPQPGRNLTVIASGHVQTDILPGAYADVTVKLGLIKLLQRRFDVCDEAKNANASIQCPVEPGDYSITQTVALPKEIPPAKFVVQVRAYDQNDTNMICVNIVVDFMPSLSSGFLSR